MRRDIVVDANTTGFRLRWESKNVLADVRGKPITIMEALSHFTKFRGFDHRQLRLCVDGWLVLDSSWPGVFRKLTRTEADIQVLFEVEDTNEGEYHAMGVGDE